jgi:hypothetical protein
VQSAPARGRQGAMKDPEVPDADEQEQEADAARPADVAEPERPHLDPEVPEADAIEQSQPAPLDDEDYESG